MHLVMASPFEDPFSQTRHGKVSHCYKDKSDLCDTYAPILETQRVMDWLSAQLDVDAISLSFSDHRKLKRGYELFAANRSTCRYVIEGCFTRNAGASKLAVGSFS
jgi:hypothetical protein